MSARRNQIDSLLLKMEGGTNMSGKKAYTPITSICKDCGTEFVIASEEQRHFKAMGFELPKRCRKCRQTRKDARKAAADEERARQEAIAKEQARHKWEEDEGKLAGLLKTLPYQQIRMSDLTSDSSTVIVTGNGFDIMHGAKSSYWNFQETLGKQSDIRRNLETYLKVSPDILWYNLEDSLSHLNAGMMLDVIDMWLQMNGCYDEDDSMAAYYGAIDTAFMPVEILINEFPQRFRKWVESLACNGSKPLDYLICKDAHYLNFNYTDFLETLYFVPGDKIKYIHGSRKKGPHGRKENIVLGHVPNVDYLADYKPTPGMVPRYKNKWKRAMLDNAMDIAIDRWVNAYESTFTKHTPEIIRENADFFEAMSDMEKVITIGHSLSEVDYPYFKEIARSNSGKAKWFIGFHNYDDMTRLIGFVDEIGIEADKIMVFRS